jgi:hypothetical protein
MMTRNGLFARLTACTLALMALMGTAATAQTEVESADKIVQLKRMANAINLRDIMVAKFSEEIKKAASENAEALPDGFAERVIENINTDDVITDVIAPVLEEYFTVKELTLLADFAEMPIAQKLVTSALNDEKIDVEKMMTGDALSEKETEKLIQIFMTFNKKKDVFAKSNIGEKLNAAFEAYGQTLALEVMGEMMEMVGEEGIEASE